MAKKTLTPQDKVYTRILNIRITEDEYKKISTAASRGNHSISSEVRQMMFGEKDRILTPYSDNEVKYKVLLAVQECRTAFKKIASRFNNAVTVYERSIEEFDDDGRRLVSTEQTIRHVAGLSNIIMSTQESFNRILELLDAQPVHYAARPSTNGVVGQFIAKERNNANQSQNDIMPTGEAEETDTQNNGIPNKYRYMFKATITGTVTEDASEFTTKKGNVMMKFTVKTMSFISGKETVHLIDVIKVKNGLFQYLKKNTRVAIVGDFDMQEAVKNSEVVIVKTVYADDITLT